MSRRFVARTTAQLAAWQSAPLDALDLVALLIEGCAITPLHVGWHGHELVAYGRCRGWYISPDYARWHHRPHRGGASGMGF